MSRAALSRWTSWAALMHFSGVTCSFLLGEQHYSMEGSLHTGLHRAGVSPDGQSEEGLMNSFSQGGPTQSLPPL